MGLFDFLKKKLPESGKQPEDYYNVTITDKFVLVEHPKWGSSQIDWKEIVEIKIITTDEGPFLPDVWIVLIGNGSKCQIPQGAKEYDVIYDLISKYEGFNFENVIAAASCTENKEFLVWTRN